MCTCSKPICPTRTCPSTCKYGIETVIEDGRNLCKCKKKPACPSIPKCFDDGCRVEKYEKECDVCKCDKVCNKRCRYGFKSMNGKQICSDCQAKRYHRCRYGYENNKNDCKRCKCKCPPRRCSFCKNGYVKDKNNCQTCRCKVGNDRCKPRRKHNKHKKLKHGKKNHKKHGRRKPHHRG